MQGNGAARGSFQGNVVGTLGERMKKAGVEGLPQNYHLFYHAYVGSNDELRLQLEGLGSNPAQDQLDELFGRFGDSPEYRGMIEMAHERFMGAASVIIELIYREQNSLEKYGELLDSTASGIAGDRPVEQELLRRIVAILASATNATVKQSKKSVLSMTEQSAELRQMRRELEIYKNLADTDPLTELWNRRAFSRSCVGIYRERRQILLTSLILIDIDGFKEFNDCFGHQVGDKVLQRVARIMKAKCGPHISAFRIGGEEFALIVEGESDQSTVQLAERLRTAVEQDSFEGLLQVGSVTVSAGICKASDADNSDDLFAKADGALYASKAQGRNRVTVHPMPDPLPPRKNWMLYQGE